MSRVGSAYITRVELCAILRDLADSIEEGDSLEGTLTYSAFGIEQNAPVGMFAVQGQYRTGNLMGQGSLTIIGDLTEGGEGEKSSERPG